MLDIHWVTPPFSLDWWDLVRDITATPHSSRASLISPPPHPPLSLTTGFLPPRDSQAPAPRHARGTSLTSGPCPGTTRQTWRPTTGRASEATPPPPLDLRATSDQLVSHHQSTIFNGMFIKSLSIIVYYLMSVLSVPRSSLSPSDNQNFSVLFWAN